MHEIVDALRLCFYQYGVIGVSQRPIRGYVSYTGIGPRKRTFVSAIAESIINEPDSEPPQKQRRSTRKRTMSRRFQESLFADESGSESDEYI